MKKIPITFFFISVCLRFSVAQHSSSDFLDAATTGPFPIYIGLGGANSFRNQDLVDVSKRFSSFFNNGSSKKTRLYGVQAFAGVSVIPKNSRVSGVVEVKYLWLERTVSAPSGVFKMTSAQSSLAVGVRWAFFPFVGQIQCGPVLRYRRAYNFNVSGTQNNFRYEIPAFRGCTGLIRVGFLDPAGTEGGPGFYFEAGFNLLETDGDNLEVTNAVKAFDTNFSEQMNGIRRYGYLSFGLLLPIAIQVK